MKKEILIVISFVAVLLSLNSCLMFEDLEAKPYKYVVTTCEEPCLITCIVGNDVKQYRCSANKVWTLELPIASQTYFSLSVLGEDYGGWVMAEIKWGDEVQRRDVAYGINIADVELSLGCY